MKVYSGFGYFNGTARTAKVEISLPLPVSLPADGYKYECKNISNASYNALLIFIKKNTDSGTALASASLNYEQIDVNLDAVPLFTDTGITASAFNYANNFILLTFHEANPAVYQAIAKLIFLDLNTIATSASLTVTAPAAATGPSKSGLGALKKM